MFAAASLHAGDAAPLAQSQPTHNDGDSRPDVGLRLHEQDHVKQPALSSTHISPAMRIYRHALESIFAMLELEDLSRVLAVSRSWSAAVRSMKPIGAIIARDESLLESQGKVFRPLPPMDSLVAGPLLRHLTGIQIAAEGIIRAAATPFTSESLALLAQHAPNLTSLWCDLTLTPTVPLILPAGLSSLELEVDVKSTAADINGALTALAALPSLSRLRVRLFDNHDADLGLLAASRSLTDLSLKGHHGAHPLSDAQMVQIRSALGHLTRFSVNFLDRGDVSRLLQPPHALRWQEIGLVDADARTGDLLVTLPTLTALKLHCGGPASRADFLSKLPLLSSLTLDCGWLISPAPLLASLLPCTGLTELNLQCKFNSAQVGALLAALTKLKRLKLEAELETLRCFASGPATQTLEDLRCERLDLPPSELSHLYALQRLRSLSVVDCFEPALDTATLDSLSPPTALFPLLTALICDQQIGEVKRNIVKRNGPSFEWMQQRLSQ